MELRPATMEDLAFLVALRNEEVNARWSRRGVVEAQAIEADYLHNPEKSAWIAMEGSDPVGYVIQQRVDEDAVEISLALLPAHRGLGQGARLVVCGTRHAFEHLGARRVQAVILVGNQASLRSFLRAGFAVDSETDASLRLSLSRPSSS